MSEKMTGKQLLRRIAVIILIVVVVLGAFFASSAISSKVRDVNAAKDQVRSDLLEAVNAVETASKTSTKFTLVPAAADFSAEQTQALITDSNTVLVQIKNNRALDLIYVTHGKQPTLLNDGTVGKSAGYQLTAVGIGDPIKNWSYTYNSATKAYFESSLKPEGLANNAVYSQGAHLTVTTKELSKSTTIAAEANGLLAPKHKVAFKQSNLDRLTYERYLSRGGKLTDFDLPASTVKFLDAEGKAITLPQGLKWNLTFIITSAPQQSRVQLLTQTSEVLSEQTLQSLSGATASISAPGFNAEFNFPLGVNVVSVQS